MKVTAQSDVRTSLTKGKEYDVLRYEQSQYIVIDDGGFEVGYTRSFLEPVKEVSEDEIIPEAPLSYKEHLEWMLDYGGFDEKMVPKVFSLIQNMLEISANEVFMTDDEAKEFVVELWEKEI